MNEWQILGFHLLYDTHVSLIILELNRYKGTMCEGAEFDWQMGVLTGWHLE